MLWDRVFASIYDPIMSRGERAWMGAWRSQLLEPLDGRVLVPGGKLHFIEHGGGAPGRRGRWQHRLDPTWSRVSAGCHLNRDAVANIAAAGFDVVETERSSPRSVPPILRPFTRGVAVA